MKTKKIKESRSLVNKIIELVSSDSSLIDILVNSNEFIKKYFKSSFYAVFVLENNILNCLMKIIKRENSILQKVILNKEELNKLLKLRNVISEEDNDYNFYKEKFNLPYGDFYLFVPIINRGNFIGIIIIGKEKKFNEKEKQIIFSVSSILAQTFSLLKSVEDKQETKNHIEALLIISNAIVEKNNIEDMLKIIVNVVAKVMQYKICSIMLYDEEKQELEIKATQSLSYEYKSKPNLKIGQSLSGRAIKERKPITAIDVTKNPYYKYPEIAKKEGLKSMLAIPMIIKNKIIGVINVYTQTEHIFLESEIKMLFSVANLAAVAIQNVQLEEETIKVKDALEARKLIEKAKGILMKMHNMSEEEAYTIMRKKAMDLGKTLKEIAEVVILSYEINKKNSKAKYVSEK